MFPISRLTRREFTGALLATAALGCPVCRAQAITGRDEVLCAAASQGVPETQELLQSTGDKSLDRSLIAELTEQSQFYGMMPAFMLYSGANQNALATAKTVLDGTQGTILYNLPFLQGQLKSTEWGGAVVAGVIAHEFGHIYQFFSAYSARLKELHSTVKFLELHADFLSGFYMAKKYLTSSVKLQDYYDAFYKLGDYAFDSKDHHGTKEERYFAIKAGYNLCLTNKSQGAVFAAAQGEAFLREYIR